MVEKILQGEIHEINTGQNNINLKINDKLSVGVYQIYLINSEGESFIEKVVLTD